jgi:hypothetical protein
MWFPDGDENLRPAHRAGRRLTRAAPEFVICIGACGKIAGLPDIEASGVEPWAP